MRDRGGGIRAGVIAYLLWALLTLYWHELEDFGAIELIGWRIVCAAVVMVAVVSIQRRWQVLRTAFATPATAARITGAALLLVANWTTYVWTIVNDRVIESALGYFMAPIGTMLIGVTVLHERTTPLRRAALVLAVGAVAVLWVSYGRLPVAALIIAVSWSLYGLLKRQVRLTPIESLASETFLMTLPAAAVVVATWSRTDAVASTASTGEWVLVLLSGVVTAVPLLFFAAAAQRVPFTILGPLQYIIPIGNFILGWLVFGEDLPASRVAGFALIWCALIAVTVDMLRLNRPAVSPVAVDAA